MTETQQIESSETNSKPDNYATGAHGYSTRNPNGTDMAAKKTRTKRATHKTPTARKPKPGKSKSNGASDMSETTDINKLLKQRESAAKKLARYDEEIAKIEANKAEVQNELDETNRQLASLLGVTAPARRSGGGRRARIDTDALARAIPKGKSNAISSGEIAAKLGVDKVTSVQLRAAGASNVGEKRAAKWYL